MEIDALLLFGRLVFGGYFVLMGINHFRNHRTMAAYAGSKGTPAPRFAVLGTGLLLLLGGLSVMSGVYPILGLAMLALFLAGVTPMMHAFWRVGDPAQRMGETVNFSKNVALFGAVLALMALPMPWAYSVPLVAFGGP